MTAAGRRRIVLREMNAADLPRVRDIEVRAYADAWPATAFEAELRNAFASYVVAIEFASGEPLAAPDPAGPAPRPWPLRWLPRRTREVAGRLVGYCGAWYTVDQLHIVTLAVEPARQGHGIAQRLLLECFNRATAAELRNIALEVRASNERARALYERFGFREQGRLRDYYKNNHEDAIVMLTDDLDAPATQARLDTLRRSHAERFTDVEWLPPVAAGAAAAPR